MRVSARAEPLADGLTTRQLLFQATTPAHTHLDPEKLGSYGAIFLRRAEREEGDALLARLRPQCPVRPSVVADFEVWPACHEVLVAHIALWQRPAVLREPRYFRRPPSYSARASESNRCARRRRASVTPHTHYLLR